ncbi:cell fate (sporulation/competence/biofilm development) regulator YlbF (YheA/YmcA/DUF963 family) [Mesobacillus stamsii]|nr:cell fate (sporulation/competence/biofilm development) regulator YlbF (YheA/YmcA/DUF963 family) [Mesobacillus stamsii]
MLAVTSERVLLMEEAEQLVSMILQSDIAEYYRECLYKVKTNAETQRKVREFVDMKDRYEEVQRFGKYHPDYKDIMGKIRLVKRELDIDLVIAEFKKAENDLQSLLDEVSVIIGRSVSDSVKVPTGNPFFESSCSGGCGSGGSCGCSA